MRFTQHAIVATSEKMYRPSASATSPGPREAQEWPGARGARNVGDAEVGFVQRGRPWCGVPLAAMYTLREGDRSAPQASPGH
jgi:hypothetical protein